MLKFCPVFKEINLAEIAYVRIQINPDSKVSLEDYNK